MPFDRCHTIVKIERALSNSIQSTSISCVKFSWTPPCNPNFLDFARGGPSGAKKPGFFMTEFFLIIIHIGFCGQRWFRNKEAEKSQKIF